MLWSTRETALSLLDTELSDQSQLVTEAFQLIDLIILECPDELDFLRVTRLIVLKARTLLHCIFSLSLDGHGQEAGAILRLVIESHELLIYIRDEPSRIKQVLDDKLPQAGKIAKINNSSSHGLKNYLSNNASHMKLTYDSIRHLIMIDEGNISINIEGIIYKKAFLSNIQLVLAYIFFISSTALDCKHINGVATDKFESKLEKLRKDSVKLYDELSLI